MFFFSHKCPYSHIKSFKGVEESESELPSPKRFHCPILKFLLSKRKKCFPLFNKQVKLIFDQRNKMHGDPQKKVNPISISTQTAAYSCTHKMKAIKLDVTSHGVPSASSSLV
ncbi:hypothetical protein Avbf_07679 [Armadillidium vulgare]|nr:hypothetical protein Avbf_07679 [Armadillidium vulgare]